VFISLVDKSYFPSYRVLAAHLKVMLIFKIALVTTGGKMRITFFGLGGTAQKVISPFPSGGC